MKKIYNLTATQHYAVNSFVRILKIGLAAFILIIASQIDLQAMYFDTPNKAYSLEGIVLDETGSPLPGANIVLQGSTYGTSSDTEGKFVFPAKVKAGDVISFSFIGYETKEYIVQDQESSTIYVEMKMDEFEILGELSVSQDQKSSRSGFWSMIKSWFD